MSSSSDTADREILLTRTFDAPRELVWSAMTDPKHVVHWWGPRGFTITTHSRDLKTGGHWHYTMHGPDGVDYINKTHYLEVRAENQSTYFCYFSRHFVIISVNVLLFL